MTEKEIILLANDLRNTLQRQTCCLKHAQDVVDLIARSAFAPQDEAQDLGQAGCQAACFAMGEGADAAHGARQIYCDQGENQLTTETETAVLNQTGAPLPDECCGRCRFARPVFRTMYGNSERRAGQRPV